MNHMLLIIGSQVAQPMTAADDQALMHAFMAYEKPVTDAGVQVDSVVLDSFETGATVQVPCCPKREPPSS